MHAHAGVPSSPQGLVSRVLESDTNYSIVEVKWEPPDNDSRADFYHYQVVVDSEGTTHTLNDVNTTNTGAIVCNSPYNVNTSFVLSANNCEGRSAPITLVLNITIGKYKLT